MSAETTHGVVGTGTAPETVIVGGLRDIVKDTDSIALPWYGKPVPEGVAHVYDYVLENEIDAVMYHTEDQTPAKAFVNAENVSLQEVVNVDVAIAKAVSGKGKILLLWDDEDNSGEKLAELVFATRDDVNLLELTNGLAPISLDLAPAPVAEVEEDPTDDGPADTTFTEEELKAMQPPLLKRMAQDKGLPAGVTGKSNYIRVILGQPLPAHAYPPGTEPKGSDAPLVADGSTTEAKTGKVLQLPVTVADSDPTQPTPAGWKPATGDEAHAQLRKSLLNNTPTEEQVNLIESFRAKAIGLGDFIIDNIPVGRNRSLAITALEDVVMRGVKGILIDP